MRTLITLADGSTLEADAVAPTLQDNLAWERHFGQSFVAVEEAAAESRAAQAEGRPINPARAMRTEWMLFFAWRQLRTSGDPKTASRFDLFVDGITDLRFEVDPDDEADEQPPATIEPPVDPTVTGASTDPGPPATA